jgi:predicted molibdopterin-dependent oxidoreductase YjgC
LLGLEPECCAEINPADARELGIEDDDTLTVTSMSGSLGLKARISHKVVIGTVFIPGNFESAPVNRLQSTLTGPIRINIEKAG